MMITYWIRYFNLKFWSLKRYNIKNTIDKYFLLLISQKPMWAALIYIRSQMIKTSHIPKYFLPTSEDFSPPMLLFTLTVTPVEQEIKGFDKSRSLLKSSWFLAEVEPFMACLSRFLLISLFHSSNASAESCLIRWMACLTITAPCIKTLWIVGGVFYHGYMFK